MSAAPAPPTRWPPRAEHVGSLLRPAALRRAIEEQDAHAPGVSARMRPARDPDALRAVEDSEIARAVERQLACGLDVVTDGEYRRAMFTNSFFDAVDGLRAGQSGLAWSNDRGEEVVFSGAPVIERRISKVASPAASEAAYLSAITAAPAKVTFPAASFFVTPGALRTAGRLVPGYASEEELQEHAVGVLRELIVEAIAAGARYVQLDYPSYVFLIDEGARERARSQGVDLERLMDRCVWADRAVLEGLPAGVRYGLHLCRGNHASSWRFAGSLEPVAERMFNELPYDTFLVEWDDLERAGDFSPLRHAPKDVVVALGAVSTKVGALESEEEIVRRVEDAARHLDLDQLALSPQCGFASTLEGNRLSEDEQWRKLELVGRVADRLWGRPG